MKPPHGGERPGNAWVYSLIEATLTADGDQTILVIEARGMPLDKVAYYGAGWQLHAEDLAAYLAGREPGEAGARFGELVPPPQELAANLSWPAGHSTVRPASFASPVR